MRDLTINTLHFARTGIYIFHMIVNTNSDYCPVGTAFTEWFCWSKHAVMCEVWFVFLYKCGLILIFKGLHYTKPIPAFCVFPTWWHSKIIISLTTYVINAPLYSSVHACTEANNIHISSDFTLSVCFMYWLNHS